MASTPVLEQQQTPTEARNDAVLEYYPMVERLARKVASQYGTPTGMEVSDLVSHGVLGLVQAYDRYDASRGVPFESYAITRIRGAIVDAIRSVDWVPRKVRTRVRKESEASARLTTELGRPPTQGEIEEHLGTNGSRRRGGPKTLLALEDTVTRGDSDGASISIGDTLADVEVDTPGEAIEDAETRRRMMEALNKLRERDALILTLYYFESVPLTEIAKVLGVTESRVSQLHMRALDHLREQLDEE